MKFQVKAEVVSHEAILAIKLHLQCLCQEYERITRLNRTGGENKNANVEQNLAAEKIKRKMLDCEDAILLFEKWTQEPVEYELEDEIKFFDTKTLITNK